MAFFWVAMGGYKLFFCGSERILDFSCCYWVVVDSFLMVIGGSGLLH